MMIDKWSYVPQGVAPSYSVSCSVYIPESVVFVPITTVQSKIGATNLVHYDLYNLHISFVMIVRICIGIIAYINCSAGVSHT